MKRTPRSASRRASRQALAKWPVPYSSRMRCGSRRMSKASRRRGLHAEGGLHRLDAGFKGLVRAALGAMLLVEPLHQIELAALGFEAKAFDCAERGSCAAGRDRCG